MLKRTRSFMEKKGIDFALLFCGKDRMKLYKKVGYQKMGKYVTYYSGSKLKKEMVAMFLPIHLSRDLSDYLKKNILHVGRGTW
jgi:hypothetical protein